MQNAVALKWMFATVLVVVVGVLPYVANFMGQPDCGVALNSANCAFKPGCTWEAASDAQGTCSDTTEVTAKCTGKKQGGLRGCNMAIGCKLVL